MSRTFIIILFLSFSLQQVFCQNITHYDSIRNLVEQFDYSKRVIPKIPEIGKKIRVIIDTDAKNEIDDQWAIALAILSQDKFIIEGFVAASYFIGGPESVQNSYEEIKTVLAFADMTNNFPIYKGSHPMRYPYEASPSEGVDFIIEKAMQSTVEDPLYVIGLGAATDIASAFLLEPRIKDRVVVFWHLRTAWPDKCVNYNVFGDAHAARLLFNSPLPFLLFDTGTDLTCSMEESKKKVWPQGKLGQYLHEYRYTKEWMMDPKKGFFDLGDIAAFVDPSLIRTEEVSCPEVDFDLTYRFNNRRGKILRAYAIDRDKTFDLFYNALKKLPD
jgi:purine nucleosidase